MLRSVFKRIIQTLLPYPKPKNASCSEERGKVALDFVDNATSQEWRRAVWDFYNECRRTKTGSSGYRTLKELAHVFGRSLWEEPFVKALKLRAANRRRRRLRDEDSLELAEHH